MTTVYIDDWTGTEGFLVAVKRRGRTVRIGQVEAVTSSGDILWLRNDGIEPRALFQKNEGYTVWKIREAPISHPPIDFVYLH